MSDITEVSQESPPPVAARSWRPVWLALAGILAAAVSIPGIAASILVGPYLLDDWRLDHIVRAVALDWRDFGMEKAKERLQFELDRQGIGEQIGDDTCLFVELQIGRVGTTIKKWRHQQPSQRCHPHRPDTDTDTGSDTDTDA